MNPFGVPLSSTTAFRAVQLILVVGVMISTLELIALRPELREEGWFSWRFHRLSSPRTARFIDWIGVEGFFLYPGVLVALGARLFAAIALLPCLLAGNSSRPLLCLLTLTSLLLILRGRQGNDGSDHMSRIALTAATLASVVNTPFGVEAGLAFIAAQSELAYATSGLLKVKKSGWRDGSFIKEILKTSTFGNRHILRVVERHRPLAILLGYSVAVGDSLLGFAAFLPPTLCLALLVFGVLLHLGIAVVLGLNTFFWSFVGTYPAIFWVSTMIYTKLL